MSSKTEHNCPYDKSFSYITLTDEYAEASTLRRLGMYIAETPQRVLRRFDYEPVGFSLIYLLPLNILGCMVVNYLFQ